MTPTEGQTTTKAKGRKPRPLTEPMVRILKNVNATRDPLHGFAGAAERGGANHSLIALYRRGYLTDDVHGASVTDAGLAALAAATGAKTP